LTIYVNRFGPFPLADIWPEQEHGWNSTVLLWRAGLTLDELSDVLVGFARTDSTISTEVSGVWDSQFASTCYLHLLLGDKNTAVEVALGRALLRDHYLESWIGFGKNDFYEIVRHLLPTIPVTAWRNVDRLLAPERIGDPTFRDTEWIWDILCVKSGKWPGGVAASLATVALTNNAAAPSARFAAAAFRHKEVYDMANATNTDHWPDTALRVLQLAKARHESDPTVWPVVELTRALLEDGT
jgi:hypothetical protein